jgi:adenylate cyclase
MVQERPGRVERRLSAILAADVAGYSRLMHSDEEATHAKLTALLAGPVELAIAEHGGRIVKNTGDGFLAEFSSAVEAVRAGMQFQTRIHELSMGDAEDTRILFRVGINIGDVIVEAHDIFGDGVNIAARLEGMATPGGICISDDTYRQIRGKIDMACSDLGPQILKNIAEPMRVWQIELGLGAAKAQRSSPVGHAPALALPDKPSIAVLPFQNMSGDPEQEYFADGMVDDIITALSRFKLLFVIARNSSFTYKGRAVDIKQVGRQLGVRYVLEGSVRKAAGRVRITGQLIDAADGSHLWADRFEGDLSDIFALQDEVTLKVVSAIQPKLLQIEIELAGRRRPGNLSAHDLFLRALPHYYAMTREGMVRALELLARALEIEPRYGAAASLAGGCHLTNIAQGWTTDPALDIAEGARLVRLALNVDENDSDALSIAGRATAFMSGDFDTAREMVDRSVALNPNSALAWEQRGWACAYAAQDEEAVRSFERAIRLSPLDPMLFSTFTGMSFAFINLGRFDEAVTAAKKALQKTPNFMSAYRSLVAALAHLGREKEAKDAAARLLELDPGFRISEWVTRGHSTLRSPLYIEGVRKAGLPE